MMCSSMQIVCSLQWCAVFCNGVRCNGVQDRIGATACSVLQSCAQSYVLFNRVRCPAVMQTGAVFGLVSILCAVICYSRQPLICHGLHSSVVSCSSLQWSEAVTWCWMISTTVYVTKSTMYGELASNCCRASMKVLRHGHVRLCKCLLHCMPHSLALFTPFLLSCLHYYIFAAVTTAWLTLQAFRAVSRCSVHRCSVRGCVGTRFAAQ